MARLDHGTGCHAIGVSGIFLFSAILAVLAMIVLYLVVPDPQHSSFHSDAEVSLSMLGSVIKNHNLLKLDIGIFVLHTVLMANFIVVPLALQDLAGLTSSHHWQVYLPVLIVSVILMAPAIILGERSNKSGSIFKGAVLILVFSQIGFYLWHDSIMVLAAMLLVFYWCFSQGLIIWRHPYPH